MEADAGSMGDFRQELIATIPQLRAFARSLTGGNRDLADDLVQETLVKSMKAEQQFRAGSNMAAWLCTILRNTFCSHVGRKRHKLEVYDEDLERLAWCSAPQEGRLETIAFRRAFKRLSPAHREVLVLSILQGHSYEAVAAIVGCQVGTVKSRVNRARAQLKAMLLGDEALEGTTERAAAERRAQVATAAPLAAARRGDPECGYERSSAIDRGHAAG